MGLLLIAGLVALPVVKARGAEHDLSTDYMIQMEAAAVTGDSGTGQAAEAARNAKISETGNLATEAAWTDATSPESQL